MVVHAIMSIEFRSQYRYPHRGRRAVHVVLSELTAGDAAPPPAPASVATAAAANTTTPPLILQCHRRPIPIPPIPPLHLVAPAHVTTIVIIRSRRRGVVDDATVHRCPPVEYRIHVRERPSRQ